MAVYFDERGKYTRRFEGMYGPRPYTPSWTISFEELDDVCQLIKHGKYPNGTFGDDECVAWSIITRVLGIEI